MRPRFVSLLDAPELATAIRHASIDFDDGPFVIIDCRNGCLLIDYCDRTRGLKFEKRGALRATRGTVVVPPAPSTWSSREYHSRTRLFLPEDGGEDGAIAVEVMLRWGKLLAHVRTLQSGIWSVTSRAGVKLPRVGPTRPSIALAEMLPPVHGRIYMTVHSGHIFEFDLAAARITMLQLPDGVLEDNFKLSCGEDSGLSLIHAEGSMLSIWQHRTSSNGERRWVLVDDTIRVHEACNHHEDVNVLIVGSNLEYVFLSLKAAGVVIGINLRSRAEKVYGAMRLPHFCTSLRIFPSRMVWPPVFPALREENNQEE